MSVKDLCVELELDDVKCRRLEGFVQYLKKGGEEPKRERKLSRWQQCIKTRRAGKGFDPSAIRELAKEYKTGKCP